MVDLHIFGFPLSLILALAPLLCILICQNSAVNKFLTSWRISAALMVIAALFIAVEGIWAPGLYRHWSFVSVVLMILLSLGSVALSDLKRKEYCALMSHLGLYLVLSGGLFGAPDRIDAQMLVFSDDRQENMAVTEDGDAVPLPFNVELKDFEINYYDDGCSPKQYTSYLNIGGTELQTSVNHPCRYKDYRIYQSGYDSVDGRYSVLKIVRDPWLPVVSLGALILVIAAILSLKTVWQSWKVLPAALVLAGVFAVLSVSRIKFGTLMPALRSFWFIPHLIVYMLAYSIMALSVITGVASLFSGRVPEHLTERLLSTASSLLLTGMICGAVWAQQAWGNYWTWDAKECWAAVTWLCSLAATHIPGKKKKLVFTVMAFLSVQMTWYGVNYLPAADNSLHTYTQEPIL